MTSLCKMQPFFLEKYCAIFSWSEYFFFLKEPVFARGVQCLKTYWLWVVQKASNLQGRRNRGAEGLVGNCCSPKGLVDQLTLSQSGRGADYAHQIFIIIKNLLVVGCAKSVKFSGPQELGGQGGRVELLPSHGFGRLINPISIKEGGRLCPPSYYVINPRDFQTFLRHCKFSCILSFSSLTA